MAASIRGPKIDGCYLQYSDLHAQRLQRIRVDLALADVISAYRRNSQFQAFRLLLPPYATSETLFRLPRSDA
jgi:hypothetical protein